MNRKKKKILIIPSIRKGNGSGHIRRSVKLAVELAAKGAEAAVLIDSAAHRMHDCYTVEDVKQFLPGGRKKKPEVLSDAMASDWDICIFDTREIPPARLSAFSGRTETVGLDEGGEGRQYFDYLIDVLPNLEQSAPNISSPGFLQLPEKPAAVEKQPGFRKILVTFGGEDQADLTGKFLELVDDTGVFEPENITVVKGPMFTRTEYLSGVTVLDSPDNLSSMLTGWDLVVTSFGLTCFEALFSGIPVVLFNPSGYHRSLSIRAGIPEIGVNKPDKPGLENYISNPERLYRAVATYSGMNRLNLADFILNLNPELQKCRGCGRKHHKVIFRNLDYSFFKCSNCGLVNRMYFGNDKMEYGPDYFFEEYKKQYGKTYLEDFDHIKAEGARRCAIIRRTGGHGKLLDIGCGYGPFLAAADEAGFDVYGTDISENAAAWVRTELGFPASAKPVELFRPEDLKTDYFDTVTMWFVIEHMDKLQATLAKINSILPVNGVFAFSTPNYNGISRLRLPAGFLASSPLDHYTIWSPVSARKLLSRYGFSVKTVRCPVIHPERFFRPGVYKRLPEPVKAAVGRLLTAAGRFFRLGDTFEVYAVKKNNIGVNA